jgi:type II secretory pathway pseudopilin PulG
MVVVVIIAILIGILVPTIGKVRQTAREAEVRKEISDLEQAIGQFKVSFGIEPPSYIQLYANQADWDANPKYKGLIKQMWSKFDFSNCGGASVGTSGSMNFVLPNSSTATVLKLNGSECLVFFLGGMIDPASGGFTGFAKDPARPFSSVATVTNREGPFFEFKGALKTPSSGTAGDDRWTDRLTDKDKDWLPEYKDPLPQQQFPYAYFNGTSGVYRTTTWTMGGAAWENLDCQELPTAVQVGLGVPSPFVVMRHAYYTANFNANANPRASLPHKAKGIQIISPGSDANYGTGGRFDPQNPGGLSEPDRDNITNLQSGRLGG